MTQASDKANKGRDFQIIGLNQAYFWNVQVSPTGICSHSLTVSLYWMLVKHHFAGLQTDHLVTGYWMFGSSISSMYILFHFIHSSGFVWWAEQVCATGLHLSVQNTDSQHDMSEHSVPETHFSLPHFFLNDTQQHICIPPDDAYSVLGSCSPW